MKAQQDKGAEFPDPPLQLKSYIPIGGPLTWVPVDGSEPNMRFVPGFDLQWYHKRVGVAFSESWHTDAELRYRAVHSMKRFVNELFPAVREFELHYNGDVEESCATISGLHGVMLVSAVYGSQVLYRKDAWPDAFSKSTLSPGEIRALEPFRLESNPVVQNLFSQMNYLHEHYSIIHGYLNYQGILNIAFKLRGSDIFTDMIDDPEMTDNFFHHIAKTTRDLALMVQKRQRESGFDVNLIGSSNCVMNMISPQMYEDALLKYDEFLSQPFDYYAMHTCNWDITPYIGALRKIPKIGYIDMGLDSDFAKVREAFPLARRNIVASPVIMHKPRQERSRIIDRVACELAPCDISMGSIDLSVADEEIRWMNDYVMKHRVNC